MNAYCHFALPLKLENTLHGYFHVLVFSTSVSGAAAIGSTATLIYTITMTKKSSTIYIIIFLKRNLTQKFTGEVAQLALVCPMLQFICKDLMKPIVCLDN